MSVAIKDFKLFINFKLLFKLLLNLNVSIDFYILYHYRK